MKYIYLFALIAAFINTPAKAATADDYLECAAYYGVFIIVLNRSEDAEDKELANNYTTLSRRYTAKAASLLGEGSMTTRVEEALTRHARYIEANDLAAEVKKWGSVCQNLKSSL
jgi:hypothetical protein